MNANVWVISHWELISRMLIAVLLGGLVGIEREWSNHSAGFRTHILVCLGSATIMLLSIYGFNQFVNEYNVRVDPSRLAAQVISGIGFLGAGAILRNGNMITGLTTAASIWVVAAIGLSVGAGFMISAVTCTCLVLVCLVLLNKWEKHVLRRRPHNEIEIVTFDHSLVLGEIVARFSEQDIQIDHIKMIQDQEASSDLTEQPTRLRLSLKSNKNKEIMSILMHVANMNVVVSLESHHFQRHKTGAFKGNSVSN